MMKSFISAFLEIYLTLFLILIMHIIRKTFHIIVKKFHHFNIKPFIRNIRSRVQDDKLRPRSKETIRVLINVCAIDNFH